MFKFTCSCCSTNYYDESERHFFVRASEHIGMIPLTGNQVKNSKKSAIFNCILLKGLDASFEDSNFKLHLKESFLKKHGKPELNRNSYSYPLDLFDWLLP